MPRVEPALFAPNSRSRGSAYLWVGVLERLEESLVLLVRLLPTYFGGLQTSQAAREHARPANTSAASDPPPSRETLHKIAMENENDVRLYRYIVRLLGCRLRRCGLSWDSRGVAKGPLPPGQSASRPREPQSTDANAPDGADGRRAKAPPDPAGFSIVANAAALRLLEH